MSTDAPAPDAEDRSILDPDGEDRSILDAEQPSPTEAHAYGPAPQQVVDVFRPAGHGAHRGLVVFVHGGYWRPSIDRQHASSLARALADEGFLTCSIEYRRVPGDPDLMVSDITRALEALPAMIDSPGARPLLVGHSAGGHLALVAAAANPGLVSGVLALAPVADLQSAEALGLGSGAVAAFLGGPAGERPDLDPVRCPEPPSATTVIHGARDSVVPLEQAHALALAWPAACRIVVVDDAAHFELIDPGSAAWAVVVAEVARFAPRPADR